MKRLRRTLLILVLPALASACASSASPNPSAIASSGATQPSASAPARLTIGLLLPFTESAVHNEIGVAQKRAAELYVKQQGGSLAGRVVQFAYSDESINGALDATKATELVDQEHADVLLGLIGDDGADAVRTYVDGKKVVFIDTNASGNALTRAIANCKPVCQSPYVFRSSFSNWQLSEPLGEWAALRGGTAFYLGVANDTFGTESAAAFVQGLAKSGGKATGQVVASLGSNWAAVVAGIKAQPTKHVFAAFAGADAVGFIEAWAQAGMSSSGYTLFGPGLLTDVDVLATVKDKAIGITTSLFWSSTLDTPENRALTDLFPKTYQNDGGDPAPANAYVVEMWDAMKALDQALQNPGSSSNPLVGALEGVSVTGARGPFSLDPKTHNVIQDIEIRKVTMSGASAVNTIVDTIPQVADPGN